LITQAKIDLLREVEQFLYQEARLLDERRFHEWLDLFTDDVNYWMPTRSNRRLDDMEKEVSGPHDLAYFNDNLDMLKARVSRLNSGMAWAEDPPSRTQHLITNVQAEETETPGVCEVTSLFMLYRGRLEHEVDIFCGTRYDTLRRVDADLKIARRKIVLAQNVIMSKNMSMFF
jgi:3-phenylpropionate/cinnamic acid dioxygenase small subunit